MRYRRRVATLLVVLTVVLAGCGGGGSGPATTATDAGKTTATDAGKTTATDAGKTTATDRGATPTDTGTTTAGTTETVQVTGGNLSVDATETFARVQRLLGTDVQPQPVEVRNLTERSGYRPGRLPLFRYLGMGNLSTQPDRTGGVTTASGKVYLRLGEGSPAEVERVLAHEFVHTAQVRANMLPWRSALDQPRMTLDRRQVRRALVEGGAVYATEAYAEKHLDGQNPAELAAARYENGSASAKFFYARYHFGYRYVADRIDSLTDLRSVYRNRPNTTEQVIHGYAPGEEPQADLAVSANASGEWSKTRNNTMGELFVRVALQTELDAGTAREAATGWGSDVLYGFVSGGSDPGWAWTVRMDSASEADQLASALETFAEERRTASDGDFRVERVGDGTVTLLFGNPAVVESASVSGSSANVTVSVA